MRALRHVVVALGAVLLGACGGEGDAASGGSALTPGEAPTDESGPASESATPLNANAAATACLPAIPECEPPALDFATRGWRRGGASVILSLLGSPQHRGRDLFVNPGAVQTVIGKFTYGLTDLDLHGEEVDVFVQRDCGSAWEKLGTSITTDDGEHAEVEGVEDSGGRIYFEIPKDKELGVGRHRVRLVVAGDGTFTDALIDVVPPNAPIFVSDIDGTLTSSELVEFGAMLVGATPETHESAPEALRALVAKGYRPMYLTARPEWLTQRSRDFLKERGFPEGVVHTSTALIPSVGGGASDFKSKEMALLAQKGLVPTFAFGNTSSDSTAYVSVVDPQNRIFYKIDGAYEGRRIEDYGELLPTFEALPAVCK